MMDSNSVCLRAFEERDIPFIYECKSNEKLNEYVVGDFHKFTYEEAESWVRGIIRADRDDMKFWAICSNDFEKNIIGWVSLSQINLQNHSACQHGIFIGNPDFRDGSAMFESMLMTMKYAFETLGMHRLYASCLSIHKTSPHLLNSLGFTLEGKKRDAVCKQSVFYDVLDYAILESEYYDNINNGNYQINKLIKNFVKSLKQTNR